MREYWATERDRRGRSAIAVAQNGNIVERRRCNVSETRSPQQTESDREKDGNPIATK